MHEMNGLQKSVIGANPEINIERTRRKSLSPPVANRRKSASPPIAGQRRHNTSPRNHREMVHSSSAKPGQVICLKCGKYYSSKIKLRMHHMKRHSREMRLLIYLQNQSTGTRPPIGQLATIMSIRLSLVYNINSKVHFWINKERFKKLIRRKEAICRGTKANLTQVTR